jgi:hypothetical protein
MADAPSATRSPVSIARTRLAAQRDTDSEGVFTDRLSLDTDRCREIAALRRGRISAWHSGPNDAPSAPPLPDPAGARDRRSSFTKRSLSVRRLFNKSRS